MSSWWAVEVPADGRCFFHSAACFLDLSRGNTLLLSYTHVYVRTHMHNGPPYSLKLIVLPCEAKVSGRCPHGCRHVYKHVFECVRVFSCCGFRHPARTRGGSLLPGCLRPAARRCRERSIDAACERFSVYTKSWLRDSMLSRASAHDCPLICVYIYIHIYLYIHV